MKNISDFIDATYLKTPKQAKLTVADNQKVVHDLLDEALLHKYKCVMIRPEYVSYAKQYLTAHKSKILVGTVIDFPKGEGVVADKLAQAQQAIENGADELDFVINYKAFKKGELGLVENQVKECTALGLSQNKTVKWIIETAALSNKQIIQLTALVKKVVLRHFKETDYAHVFIKSSTGFFKTRNNLPNGATPQAITLMIENAAPLPVKASGGIKNREDALFYLGLGVKRIGTSAQKTIVVHDTSH